MVSAIRSILWLNRRLGAGHDCAALKAPFALKSVKDERVRHSRAVCKCGSIRNAARIEAACIASKACRHPLSTDVHQKSEA